MHEKCLNFYAVAGSLVPSAGLLLVSLNLNASGQLALSVCLYMPDMLLSLSQYSGFCLSNVPAQHTHTPLHVKDYTYLKIRSLLPLLMIEVEKSIIFSSLSSSFSARMICYFKPHRLTVWWIEFNYTLEWCVTTIKNFRWMHWKLKCKVTED